MKEKRKNQKDEIFINEKSLAHVVSYFKLY